MSICVRLGDVAVDIRSTGQCLGVWIDCGLKYLYSVEVERGRSAQRSSLVLGLTLMLSGCPELTSGLMAYLAITENRGELATPSFRSDVSEAAVTGSAYIRGG